ncbi:MAG: hypothetical protein JSS09_05020 [Verrucomicrobia bacterium]|nr:hypothetical protein [Verrucomicrobiota bacterium]
MAKEKQKICSHCEGRISVEADTCLYCGMPLVTESAVSQVAQESVISTYSPPYGQKSSDYMKIESEFAPKFKSPLPREDAFSGITPSSSEAALANSEEGKDKSGFIALVLALLGSNLLILGLMQGLFSDGGILRLEWDCSYWFLFCLLAVPMLYFGIKKSKVS